MSCREPKRRAGGLAKVRLRMSAPEVEQDGRSSSAAGVFGSTEGRSRLSKSGRSACAVATCGLTAT